MSATPTRLLFVCIENANRSQMAQAFARMHARPGIEAYSAGSRPLGRVNPKAIASMRERGYDLSTHRSRALDELPDVEFDAVVSMGCGDACPWIPARHRVDWTIPDPRELPPDEFGAVRDLIEWHVRELLRELGCEREAKAG